MRRNACRKNGKCSFLRRELCFIKIWSMQRLSSSAQETGINHCKEFVCITSRKPVLLANMKKNYFFFWIELPVKDASYPDAEPEMSKGSMKLRQGLCSCLSLLLVMWHCTALSLFSGSSIPPTLCVFSLLALFESREFLIPCVSAACNCSRCYGDIIKTNSSSATQLIPSAHSFARLHILVNRQLRDCSIKQ